MEEHMLINFVRKHKVLILLLVFSILALWLASRYGYITVEIEESKGGEFTYEIKRHGEDNAQEIKSSSSTIKKLVPKGNYEILVKQGNASSFSIVKTKGFFTVTAVNTKMAQERARRFVGNNPAPCMFYTGILYSYNCTEQGDKISTHVPATSSQPTYVEENSAFMFGDNEGIVKTQEGVLALVHVQGEGSTSHIIYKISGGKAVTPGLGLTSLDSAKDYSIVTYRSGFLVYDDSFEDIKYYSSINAAAQGIKLESPADNSLKPLILSASGSSIVIAYSNNTEGEVSDFETQNNKVMTEVIVYNKQQVEHYSLKGQYSDVNLCGNNKLCLVGLDGLTVYDINGKSLRPSFEVGGVKTIQNSNKGLLAVRGKDVLNLNVDNSSGFVSYSLGDFQFCGIQNDTGGYLLCLINNKNKKVALRIDQNSVDSDSIDKKVEKLQKLSEVSDVSIYDKYVFVSPSLGDLVYLPAIRSYGYNPTTKQRVNNEINNEVGKLGINRSVYQITNTVP